MKYAGELIYVGKSYEYENRLSKHKHAGINYNPDSKRPYYRSLIAYLIFLAGFENIEHFIFEEGLTEKEADIREFELIEEHKPVCNWNTGGKGKGKKMSKAWYDKAKRSTKTRQKIGKANRGSKSGNAILNEELAMEIFNASGTQQSIAERYGVERSRVSKIKNKKIWKHIHDDVKV